jgi:hypothetical protein
VTGTKLSPQPADGRPFPFYKLTPELQTNVLRYVLGPKGPDIPVTMAWPRHTIHDRLHFIDCEVPHDHSTFCQDCRTFLEDRFFENAYAPSFMDSAILKVSKALREEGMRVLFDRIYFTFLKNGAFSDSRRARFTQNNYNSCVAYRSDSSLGQTTLLPKKQIACGRLLRSSPTLKR